MTKIRTIETLYKKLNIHIGKLPIMLRSSICVLTQHNHLNSDIIENVQLTLWLFYNKWFRKNILLQERAAK